MFVFIRRSQIGLVTSDIIPELLLMYSQWAFSPYFLCENMHEGKPFSFLKPGCSSRLFPANLQTELRSCSCKMSPQPEIMGREGNSCADSSCSDISSCLLCHLEVFPGHSSSLPLVVFNSVYWG